MRAFSAAAALVLLAVTTRPVSAAEPVVSLWYRGTPAGTPRLDDLAAIRAVGFAGVTWPAARADAVAEVGRLAGMAGLTLFVQPEGLAVDGRLDIDVRRVAPGTIPAFVWRAVGRGVRIVSFDPGHASGTGLGEAGSPPDWLTPAVALARQLSGNATLIAGLTPGPRPVFLSLRLVSVDVTLLEGPRAWVLIATNTGPAAGQRMTVQLPSRVPYAIWVSLIDGSTIAMRDRAAGAEWTFDLPAGGAAAYVIDK